MQYPQVVLEPFLTVQEIAEVLKTSKKAIYAMHERGLIGGARKIGRRLLFKESEFVDWLDSKAVSQRREL